MWELAAQGQAKGVWFWAGLYAFIVCTYSLMYQIRVRQWPMVEGTIVTLGIRQFGSSEWSKSDQDFVFDAKYNYKVSGKSYQGSRVSPWIFIVSYNLKILLKKQSQLIDYYPNGMIKVYHHPNKPQKSFLIKPGRLSIVVTVVLSLLPSILFMFKYY